MELLKENSLIYWELQKTDGAEDDFDDADNEKAKDKSLRTLTKR